MKQKEDLRIIKTKKNLYEGLLKLLREKPFEEIKVSDICSVSLINRSTFYDHFSDKYELLGTLIKDLEKELEQKLSENKTATGLREYYINMIKLLLDHVSENITTYESIIKKNKSSIASDMFKNTLQKDIEKNLKTKKEITKEIPAEIITNFYVSAVINVCLLYITDSKKYKKENVITYIEKLLPKNLYNEQKNK